jgi:hypothetical protein
MDILDGRNGTTACVPERKDVDGFRRDAVVEMVVDTAEVHTPDAWEFGISGESTNTRLASNERKGPLDFLRERSRSCNSIEFPPCLGFVDFRGRATSDSNRKQLTQARLRRRTRRVSPEMVSPCCAWSIA